jgi:hypothetical protein
VASLWILGPFPGSFPANGKKGAAAIEGRIEGRLGEARNNMDVWRQETSMTLRSIKTRIAGAIGAALLGSFGIAAVVIVIGIDFELLHLLGS